MVVWSVCVVNFLRHFGSVAENHNCVKLSNYLKRFEERQLGSTAADEMKVVFTV